MINWQEELDKLDKLQAKARAILKDIELIQKGQK